MAATPSTLERPTAAQPSAERTRASAQAVVVGFRSRLPGRLRGEAPAAMLLVLVGMLAHGWNMFNSPAFSFLGDEGIYAQQAWAVLREGR